MKSKLLFFGMVLVVVSGCGLFTKTTPSKAFTHVKVRTSYSPSAKFPPGWRYAFVQFDEDTVHDSEAAIIDGRIRKALLSELKKKGFKAGEYEGINFFVVYALGFQQHVDIMVAKSKVKGNEWINTVVAPDDYVNGALVVQIIDAKSMEPVWLGVFNADITLSSVSEQEKDARAQYAVSELLKSFPPK